MIETLSYSKIKTLDTCSFLFYCRYILNLPEESNTGAKLGTVLHELVEILSNRGKYEKLVTDIKYKTYPPSLNRLIKRKLKKQDILNDENFESVQSFLTIAVTHDFWMEGSTESHTEKEFKISFGKIFLKGFIDKIGIYGDTNNRFAIIRDFKSQKNRFTEAEMEYPIQALMYMYAAKKMFPDIILAKSRVEFILLRYPEDPLQVVQGYNDDTINGFGYYLEDLVKFLLKFNEAKAKGNYAKNDKKKTWLCGFCSKPGELKKNGEKKWHCLYRFPFDYYAIKNKDNKVIRTSKDKLELESKLSEGEKIVKEKFLGCPAWAPRDDFNF